MNSKNTTNILTWKGIAYNTIEHCRINIKSSLTVFTGSVTGLIKENAILIYYEIRIDQKTNESSVVINSQKDGRILFQIRGMEGKWYGASNEHLNQFDDCEYFDISVTPLTNVFPINRLQLKNGESKIIRVIYIDALENKIRCVQQRYTFMQDGKYLYENFDTGFTAELTVDAAGYVISYPGIWRRVFPVPGSAAGEFTSALISEQRHEDIQEDDDIYAPLLGSWKLIITDLMGDIRENKKTGEWHFSRVLEGRAIQDILIAPVRDSRPVINTLSGNRYGSILRTFDLKKRQWTMNWFNPVTGVQSVLTTRLERGKIIQESKEVEGTIMRWVFDNIKEDTFHWYGEQSMDHGKTWTQTVEFYSIRFPVS